MATNIEKLIISHNKDAQNRKKVMQDNLQVTMDEFLPLRDVVFNTLRQAILTGELKPGERLMEIHLANKLGVSRTPIPESNTPMGASFFSAVTFS